MIVALAIGVIFLCASNAYFIYQYEKIKKRVTFVESSEGFIESMLDVHEDLMRFGKSTIEIKRLDPAGFLYREPVR